MKRYFFISLAFVAALSCSRERVSEPVTETLIIEGTSPTRVRLSDEIHSVWETGDQVSVFFNGGANECWLYNGEDGASSGTLTYTSNDYRFGSMQRVVAVYPYAADNSLSGDVVSLDLPAVQPWRAGTYGAAVLSAVSTNERVTFQYANAFVRLAMRGSGTVASVTLHGAGDEVLAGPALLDVSGGSPVLTLAPSASATSISVPVSVTLSRDTDTFFYFALPSVTLPGGFIIDVTMSNGDVVTVRHTFPETLAAGEVLCIDAEAFEESTLTVDFSGDEFTPAFSTSSSRDSTKAYRHKSGYDFFFVPRRTQSEREKDASWGYSWRSNNGGELVFGRGGSHFLVPQIPGKILTGLYYIPGSTSGSPRLVSDLETKVAVSNALGTTVAGETYRIAVTKPAAGETYYFMVNSGNVVIRKLIFTYIDE